MNTDLAVVLALLASAIAMFAINKPRMDAVGLLMLTALPLTGVISMKEALAGFSDPNIVLLGALFVIGEGLVRTGVAQQLGDWLIRTAGSSETRLVSLLMAVVAGLGAFMSSTGVVAIFIPVSLRIAKSTGIAASQLMMPLSAAALISGMMTLVATAPNLVVNSELVRHGLAGFTFFSFTPFGVPVLILGIIYMLFARRWLSSKKEDADDQGSSVSLLDWIKRYNLADREYRLRVTGKSPLIGKTLGEIDLRSSSGLNIIAVERKGRFSSEIFTPTRQTEWQSGDTLLVDRFAPKIALGEFCPQYELEVLPLTGSYFSDHSQEIGMIEVMVAADSDLVGKTVVEARFRSRFRLTVIGLRHGEEAAGLGLLNKPLRIGDTLLLIGPWKEMERLQSDTREGGGVAGSGKVASGLGLFITHGRPDGQRSRSQCAGRPDRLPGDGRAALHRSGQCLQLDPLEEPHSDCRHASLLHRTPENRRRRTGRRGTDGSDRRCRNLCPARKPLWNHGPARALYLQYSDGCAHGSCRTRHRGRFECLALSLCHDCRPLGLHRIHDADFITSEHPGGCARKLPLWRLRPHRRPILHRRHDCQCPAGAATAASLSSLGNR